MIALLSQSPSFVHALCLHCSVVSGFGELDINQDTTFSSPVTPLFEPIMNTECPYLLLDVRYKEDFDQCHIITGKIKQIL